MGVPLSEAGNGPRFEHSIVSAVLHLREHGWAIIDNVIPRYMHFPIIYMPLQQLSFLSALFLGRLSVSFCEPAGQPSLIAGHAAGKNVSTM
jgi:hypothetical protein